jgi:hypothetical protein
MLKKNVAGQGIYLVAWDTLNNQGKTGDAANITGNVSKDGGAGAGFGTANPTEIGGGVYWQPLAQGETNANEIACYWSSATANIQINPRIVSTDNGGLIAASVTGAVGSVTGAVGSVTGAVGSVTGAVGSVTGAVGSVTGAVGSVTAAVTVDGTSALTEAYPAKNGALTLATALYNILQHLEEASIAGTTKTVKKRDQSTPAETLTLDDPTNPTSITRAT